jgi:hypothetical protein
MISFGWFTLINRHGTYLRTNARITGIDMQIVVRLHSTINQIHTWYPIQVTSAVDVDGLDSDNGLDYEGDVVLSICLFFGGKPSTLQNPCT